MAVFNFPWNASTKMRVMCSVSNAPSGRLFTSQRVRRRSWYGSALFFLCFMLGLGWSPVNCWGQEDVVELHVNWGESDWSSLLDQPSKTPLWRLVSPLDSLWNGVEVLDERLTWEPCAGECLEHLNSQVRKAMASPWLWSVQQANGHARLVGEGGALRKSDAGWERLVALDATLGASPAQSSRVVRDWPTSSARSSGTWVAFATTEEGVHCMGYDQLLEVGLQPEDLTPSSLRLFGQGGGILPFENDADRPLDMPQQRVVFRGLDDGSFDPGDEVCWYARAHERWEWEASDGWSHQAPFWGDTAKWYLRIDADDTIPLASITAAAPYDGAIDDTRIAHLAYGVEERHDENLIRSGRNWFGTRLSSLGANTKSWNISIPGAIAGQEATIEFAAAMRTTGSGSGSELVYAWEGETLSLTDNLLSPSSLAFAGYRSGAMTAQLTQPGLQVLATLNPGTDDSNAWMDYLAYQVPQSLVFSGGQMAINGLPVDGDGNSVEGAQYLLGGSPTPDAVWDVTDPLDVHELPLEDLDGALSWSSSASEVRRFWAFRWSAAKRPMPLGPVPNVNLHALGEVDYVVVTVPSLAAPADSLASLHAALGRRVAVVQQQAVFDAFSSGVADPTAIKMLMMMLRDRALASDGALEAPKYLLLMGDASYDNRNLQGNGDLVVGHYSQESLLTTTSYISDDYFALTAEGQGERPEDLLQLGVGRIPAQDEDAAWAVVEKVATYLGFDETNADAASCLDPNGTSSFGPWRNRILFVSDDQDGNNQDGHRYMDNSEEHSTAIQEQHPEYDILKVYPDAYVQTNTPGGERYADASEEIGRRVDEGALIVNYIGHGGERGWAHERILNMETIQSWTNLRRLPIFMTATCELFRYDDPEIYSAGEAILFNPKGGAAALLTTTRTVYSAGNQQVNRAFFETALDSDQGQRCLGDIYRDTKNSEAILAHTNSRNFSLMGDPGLEVAYPKHRVFLTDIPDTLKSLDLVTIRGYVGTESGDTLTGFDGALVPTVFDKRATVTTLDNDASEGPFVYEVFQNILHKGLASVEDGVFEFRFIVPRDIDYTFGTGRISCYALGVGTDAHGRSEEFVIGGTSENPLMDDDGPVVELFINDTLFKDGDLVHEDPWLFARIFDESGINTSGVGIGHDAKAILDGNAGAPYVLNEYFVSDLDTYQRGSIRFPFQNLEEGTHQLSFKVWDVANNSSSAETHFVVASSLEVALLEVLAYPNPAVEQVTFRMAGNQACRPANVRLDIFDIRGGRVHTETFEGEVLGFRDDVMTWDLKPSSGQRVPPGVYVFRVTWENEIGQAAQYADKLVVLRPQ